jgi:hypothetical protein
VLGIERIPRARRIKITKVNVKWFSYKCRWRWFSCWNSWVSRFRHFRKKSESGKRSVREMTAV